MMYPKGHRRLDEELVRTLSLQHELIVVDDGRYFPEDLFRTSNIEHIKVFQPFCNRWEPLKRALRKLSLFLVLFKLNNRHYDVLLFLNCHNVLYEIEGILPRKKRIIIHHNDVDVLFANNHFLREFNKVKTHFKHVFLADYIKDNFKTHTGISSEFVFTVHQPLVFEKEQYLIDKKENLLVGIGNSLDEDFITEAISYDKENSNSKLLCKLLLRSREKLYTGTYLSVITGFLPREEYERLFSIAKISIVYYPLSYKFRYSGIIDDSLAKGLVVYCNDTLCGRYFASKYPHCVYIFHDVKDIWTLMKQPLPSISLKERELFYTRHSSDYVLAQLNRALNG